MSNVIKSLHILILTIFSYSVAASSSDVLLKFAAQQDVHHDDKGAFGLASDAFKQVLENFGDLDFYTSTSLSVVIPGTGKALVYDWKEVGSGDIFIPFTTIKPIMKPLATATTPAQFSATDLVKILLENEVLKKGKKFSLTTNFELTPMRLFVLKMALLAKYAYVNNDASVVAREVVRMLVKLSLVDDIKLLDRSKTLSSYLPEVVIDSLDGVCPGLTDALDEVWTCIMTEQPDQLVIPVQAHAYLFKDAALADECFKLVQSKKSDEFVSTVEEFVAQKKCQVCSSVDVKKFKGAPLNAMIKKLVGKHHASDVMTDKDLSSLLVSELAQTNDSVMQLIQQNAGGDEHWIISLSSDLGFFSTLKQVIRVLIKSVKELIVAKQEFAKNNPGHIISRHDSVVIDEKISTPHYVTSENSESITRQLTALTGKLAAKKITLDAWYSILREIHDGHDADVEQKINDVTRECDDLRKNIAYQHKILNSLQNGEALALSVDPGHSSAQGMILLGALRDILAEFTSEIPQVIVLKKALMNNLMSIVAHSQHIKEHSDAYRYIIMTSFPEFLTSFDEAVVA